MQIPAWVLILAAIGLFVYQTLDACDGKQARRTGNSSSLGELFDHGCDAVSTSKLFMTNISSGQLTFVLYTFSICFPIRLPICSAGMFNYLDGCFVCWCHKSLLHRTLANLRFGHTQVWQIRRDGGPVYHYYNSLNLGHLWHVLLEHYRKYIFYII